VPYLDDESDYSGERIARDAEGRTYSVPADMTYKDWKTKFVNNDGLTKGKQGDIIGSRGDNMKILPRADEVIIPLDKFTKYALNPKNSRGKYAAFKDALGYDLNNAALLMENIRSNLTRFPAEYKGNKGYGDTYSVLMKLTGENGKTANVITAWIDDTTTDEMRLTSAYVTRKRGNDSDKTI
jgi:hypothetical protein